MRLLQRVYDIYTKQQIYVQLMFYIIEIHVTL